MKPNINFYEERKDLAASFRWAERINLHEGVANHFSLAVNEDGTEFLMNPNMWHFSRIKASDLLLLNANDKSVLQKENPPDATAWGLHGAIHKNCKHARCVMHVHSIYATVLASLEEDIIIPPINQISCLFFGKQIIDTQYGGLAFEEEGQRCSNLLKDESFTTMIMGNHGLLVIGSNVAEAFTNIYFLEKACSYQVRALSGNLELNYPSEESIETTRQQGEGREMAAALLWPAVKRKMERLDSSFLN